MTAAALVLELAIPKLPDAACKGRHQLFDPPGAGVGAATLARRQAAALELCSRCPALVACRAWFDALPPTKRPPGVIAGRIHPTKAKRC